MELKSFPYNILTLYSTDLITPLIHEYNESPDSIYFYFNWELLGQLRQGKNVTYFETNVCTFEAWCLKAVTVKNTLFRDVHRVV
jgi:hypothetical protein